MARNCDHIATRPHVTGGDGYPVGPSDMAVDRHRRRRLGRQAGDGLGQRPAAVAGGSGPVLAGGVGLHHPGSHHQPSAGPLRIVNHHSNIPRDLRLRCLRHRSDVAALLPSVDWPGMTGVPLTFSKRPEKGELTGLGEQLAVGRPQLTVLVPVALTGDAGSEPPQDRSGG